MYRPKILAISIYGLPPNHASYFPLYAECVELNIPVLILTGHTAVNLSNETGRPSSLDDMAYISELKCCTGRVREFILGVKGAYSTILEAPKFIYRYLRPSSKIFPEPILRFLKRPWPR